MKNYRLLNNITGWIVFIIAAAVYLLTMEPTASFWDCGEFISTAFKQEVGHPPGAPLFMIMGKFFTLFAGGDLTRIAFWMNSMSALASGFTILFLFWTITHLARKILVRGEESMDTWKLISILGAGTVGALAYTFSDTFWFSAVEAEVYGSSSFFTAITFWAVLKWEDNADNPHSHRWIILIAYLIGLSVGVHLLNLLAIPALVYVYYFRKYTVSRKGIILAGLISVAILGSIMYVIIPGVPWAASVFELIFVNAFHLPFNSGLIFFVLLLTALVIWGIRKSITTGKVLANIILTSIAVILIGYASYSMIIIRSAANPILDENNPETPFSLLSYLNREQYGDNPLIYGQYYNAPLLESKEGKKIYTRIGNRYEVTGYRPVYVFDDNFKTFFPRMFSENPTHVQAYKKWGNIKGRPVRIEDRNGEKKTEYIPTFSENLRYFFRYQVGFMYFRYFMWNFAGRQNDVQGHGIGGDSGKLYGNWLSGLNFIDEARLGPQDNLPGYLANNKARNTYYLLPLLLGLAGVVYHYMKDKRNFAIITMLFFMTGLAIVLYLNQKPFEPRERDYAYAGSFYAFAIWIGLGVLALIDLFNRVIPKSASAILSTFLCIAVVPAVMANENWDDHDRSDRYTARDFAINYLNSCAPNAILFTNGDNDTFPLWYAQEVEGVRTDVRVVNLSYLGADWYIDQMKKKAYESDPLPISLRPEQYRQGSRDAVYIVEQTKQAYELKELMDWVDSDNPRTKKIPNYGGQVDNIPTRNFFITIDSSRIKKENVLSPSFYPQIVNRINVTLDGRSLTKSDLMVLNMLSTNNWKRPVYFAITVSRENWLHLDPYFQQHGLSYKIVPVNSPAGSFGEPGGLDPDIMYDNMMNKFVWGNSNDPSVYLDENNLRMLANFRNNFSRLASALIARGSTDSALKVLDRSLEILPPSIVPHNYFSLGIAEDYYRLNQPEKANVMVKEMKEMFSKELRYYYRLNKVFQGGADQETRIAFYILQDLLRITETYDQKELNTEVRDTMKEISLLFGIPGFS
jgi:hypothetical protein